MFSRVKTAVLAGIENVVIAVFDADAAEQVLEVEVASVIDFFYVFSIP